MAKKPASRRLPDPVPQVVIEAVQPVVDGGRFLTKAIAGDPLKITANVFSHGHSLVRALVRYRRPGARQWQHSPMTLLVNDEFEGEITPLEVGLLDIEIAAEPDDLAAWARDARRRLLAAKPDEFDPEIGRSLLERAAGDIARDGRRAGGSGAAALAAVRELAETVGSDLDVAALDAIESDPVVSATLATRPIHDEGAAARFAWRAQVSRERAAFSSWYELFPRSASPDEHRPGRLADVTERLGYVEELGFDVLYLPPIHPIGETARKGKDNTTTPEPGDVGSPWAIGGREGGHDTVNPALGTIEDYERLIAAAGEHGLEVAMDLAFQCSPDHPWVTEHPEWFRHRPDGSIACAENPPKRYDDIYPLDFDTTDREGLWRALYDLTLKWARLGIRIFRVDNPHTKPFAFWEWLISEVKGELPETIFLSEAFTRPKVMHRLAKLGFDQSYTYFTWRYDRWEIIEYFNELSHGPGANYFRPNVWPNTPDILAKSLQSGGRASFVSRLVLAAGLSASYGIYGPVFELMWDQPAAEGSEEYLHSEKYEVHHHDLADPRSLAPLVARANAARRQHRALQRNDGLRFLFCDNEQIVAWMKRDRSGTDVVIGVVSLDPHWEQEGLVDVDLGEVSVPPGEVFSVHDMLTGATYRWQSGRNYVRLDPAGVPAHLLAMERP